MLRATTACTFSTSQRQKVVRDRQFLTLLTWKCASRHNGVHFFDIATSKSGPRMVCFVHFDLEMCFAPQRRALFRHRNFKKWSENGVFCTFWLGNVLRATTACTFSSLIWPAGSAPAALASLLFDPPEPQIIGKTQWIATFSVSRRSYLFAHLHLLSSDLFSSDSSHLCFSTVHIVGSFTSKLPSMSLSWGQGGTTSDDNAEFIQVPETGILYWTPSENAGEIHRNWFNHSSFHPCVSWLNHEKNPNSYSFQKSPACPWYDSETSVTISHQ